MGVIALSKAEHGSCHNLARGQPAVCPLLQRQPPQTQLPGCGGSSGSGWEGDDNSRGCVAQGAALALAPGIVLAPGKHFPVHSRPCPPMRAYISAPALSFRGSYSMPPAAQPQVALLCEPEG